MLQNIYDYMRQTKNERQAHLNLTSPCEVRGTNSTECRALLAVALETTLPRGHQIHCCYACHNGACSNWKHLYWGTAQENIHDAVANGTLFVAGKFGKDNPNYMLAPWRNGNGKPQDWESATLIYDAYVTNGWDWNKYGYGHTFLMERFALGPGPAKNILDRFRNGWVPYEDQEWIEDFDVVAYGI